MKVWKLLFDYIDNHFSYVVELVLTSCIITTIAMIVIVILCSYLLDSRTPTKEERVSVTLSQDYNGYVEQIVE